jgi:signal transduction histidine kinase
MLAYAGKGRFVLEKLDLSRSISEIVPLLRTSISRSIQLELNLDPGLPAVEGDVSQMQQLIMNLAINGAEAIGDGHGTVSIGTSWRETDAERQIELRVTDTGGGMDENIKAQMIHFSPRSSLGADWVWPP